MYLDAFHQWKTFLWLLIGAVPYSFLDWVRLPFLKRRNSFFLSWSANLPIHCKWNHVWFALSVICFACFHSIFKHVLYSTIQFTRPSPFPSLCFACFFFFSSIVNVHFTSPFTSPLISPFKSKHIESNRIERLRPSEFDACACACAIKFFLIMQHVDLEHFPRFLKWWNRNWKKYFNT